MPHGPGRCGCCTHIFSRMSNRTRTPYYWYKSHLTKQTHRPRDTNRSNTQYTPKIREQGRSARGKVLGGPSCNPLEVGHHVLKGARPVFQAAPQRHRKPSDGTFMFLNVVWEAQSGVMLLDVFSNLPCRRFNHMRCENEQKAAIQSRCKKNKKRKARFQSRCTGKQKATFQSCCKINTSLRFIQDEKTNTKRSFNHVAKQTQK